MKLIAHLTVLYRNSQERDGIYYTNCDGKIINSISWAIIKVESQNTINITQIISKQSSYWFGQRKEKEKGLGWKQKKVDVEEKEGYKTILNIVSFNSKGSVKFVDSKRNCEKNHGAYKLDNQNFKL